MLSGRRRESNLGYHCCSVGPVSTIKGRSVWMPRSFPSETTSPCHVLHKGGKIDFEDIEAFIIDRFESLDVLEVSLDPSYLGDSMDIVDMRLPESALEAMEPSLEAHAGRPYKRCLVSHAEGKLKHPQGGQGDPLARREHGRRAGVLSPSSGGCGRWTRGCQSMRGALPMALVVGVPLRIKAPSTKIERW